MVLLSYAWHLAELLMPWWAQSQPVLSGPLPGACVKQHQPCEAALEHGQELSREAPHIPDQGYTQLHRHWYPYF